LQITLNNFKSFIVLWIIYSSSVLFRGYENLVISSFFLLLFTFILIFQLKIKLDKKYLLYSLGIILPIIISLILNNDFQLYLGYLKLVFIIILASLIPSLMSYDDFSDYYIKWMVTLSAASLSIYGILLIYPSIVSGFPTIHGYSETNKYYNLWLYAYRITESKIYSNSSIFWEPGAFQVCLNLALIFELHKNQFKHLHKILLFMVCIITTFSTTGYICLLIIIFIQFIKHHMIMVHYKNMKRNKIYFRMFIGLMVIGGLYSNVLEKVYITKFSSDNYSYFSRSIGTLVDLKIFTKAPLIGVGTSGYKSLVPTIALNNYFIEMGGSTNSLTRALATYGIIFIIPLLIFYFTSTIIITNKIFERLLYFLIIVIFFMTEHFAHSLLWLSVGFYGLQLHCRRTQFFKKQKQANYQTFSVK
jgi:hypothetical protein